MRGGPARAHPVVSALKETGAIDPRTRESAELLIDARARLLYEPQFAAFEDFQTFIRNAEAPLAVLAIADMENAPAGAVATLGEAYALARFAPLLAQEERVIASDECRRLYDRHASALREMPARLAGRLAFLSLGRGYAARTEGERWPTAKRLKMFLSVLTGRF